MGEKLAKLNKTVFVGMSGGVDSSVSAALLKDQGYDVVGVFIRTWQPDFIECTWRTERRDAMRVCAHLNIPFLECDGVDAYKKGVADYMIDEYKKGNTPNPDVMCNREVKFGIFWQFAKAYGADFIATGHYAIVDLLKAEKNFQSSLTPFSAGAKNGTPPPVASQDFFCLSKSTDSSKDQSYFLWTLNQDDLLHTLFPVGHLEKREVRELAVKYKIPVATKKDSQGVCFLGPLDMKDFLKHFIESKEGNVLDEKGAVIGHHDGAVFFTLGERHGFTITKNNENSKALYIVSKDIDKNTITVGEKLKNSISERSGDLPRGPEEREFFNFSIKNINWINGVPKQDKKYTAQIRYHGELLDCNVILNGDMVTISFKNKILVSSGQSIVVYDGSICMGGGVVV